MSIDKTIIKSVLKTIGVPFVIFVGTLTGMNFYVHHNVSYKVDDKTVFKKIDGIFAHTALEIDKEDNSVSINRYSFGKSRFYTDENNDGRVERVFEVYGLFTRGPGSRMFYIDKHLKQYPQVFEKANQDFNQQMKRFKPLYKDIKAHF